MAILMVALAPAISHAFGPAGASWIEVCTAQGTRWIPGNAEAPGEAPAVKSSLAHCMGCLGHVATLPPPTAEVIVLVLGLKAEFPSAFLSAPTRQNVWVTAHSRAPPLFS